MCGLPQRVLGVLLLLSAALPAQLAIRGGEVHPVSGPVIKNGVVLVRDGKIEQVGPRGSIQVPAGYEILRAAVVTPGLIDTHTVVGLAGYLNQDQDQDQLDGSKPIQPALRAQDAYNARERLVAWVRSFGVTSMNTGHAPGSLISGQTMIVKTRGDTVEQALVRPFAMLAATLGPGAEGKKGKSPGTRAKVVALLRAAFIKAQEYQQKRARADEDKRPERDLEQEALGAVLARQVPLLITAQKQQDIMAALRLAREFKFRLVLDGAAEAYLVTEAIKRAGVWVIVHPPMLRTRGETENAAMDLALRLDRAGIPFTFQSGFESYVPKTRVVLLEAAIAAGAGLPRDRTLRALTLDAARLLGLEKRLGSLEKGKDADLALYDGDPFEYTSHCIGTIIDGQLLYRGRR